MSKKVAPRVQLNFEPEVIDQETGEENPNFIYDDEVDVKHPQAQQPIEIPEVIERDEIVEKDIFDNINPSLNGLNEDIVIDEVKVPETPIAKQPQAKQKKTTKTKRKLSEEHRAKLALAREKALATRRKNAEEKKKMKEIENKTKELKKKKAQKDLEQLEDEVKAPPQQTFMKETERVGVTTFSKKDLEDAQFDAIMKYDALRKQRKEEKKKQQMIEQQKKDLQKKIQGYGARDNNGRLLNRWDACY